MNRYAIVGFGCAGYHAAKAIRQSGDNSVIDVYEMTDQPPANPMLTTYYAGDRISFEGAHPFGTMEKIKQELGIQIFRNVLVKTVFPAEKEIELADGQRCRYDKILLSTGAKAILPPMKGLPDKRVFLMRTMDDAVALKSYLENHVVKRALVVGASMVGIKLAELFYNKEIPVMIADMAPFLFPLAAYESVARQLEERLVQKGSGKSSSPRSAKSGKMQFKWQAGIKAITANGALFTDDQEVAADIICLCIGTRANVELVANLDVIKGQKLQIQRGIVVNQKMETNIPGIYAAGDCCEGNNLQTGETSIIGLWANAAYQGETAGQNMAGVQSEYPGSIVHNITHYLHTDFIGLGDTRLPGETVTFGQIDGDLYIEARVEGKKLNSVNIIGGKHISGILKSWLLKKITDQEAELSEIQKGILIKNGITQEFIDRLGGKL